MRKKHELETVKCAANLPGKDTDALQPVPAAQKVVTGYQQ